MKVFTVYDSKAEAYLNPFLMETKGQAIRGFTDACNDEKTELNKHPGDYTLFEIGEWDQHTGTYTMLKAHIKLGLALEFKNPDTQLELPIQRKSSPVEARVN